MQTADVTIHVDETLSHDRRIEIAEVVRESAGVADVIHHDKTSHLIIVKYNPDVVTSRGLLDIVKGQGVHAELVGM